jgi:hypothetical protein
VGGFEVSNGKAVIKKIELELYFDEDFVPPDKFGDPCPKNSACTACPFYMWDDEAGEGWCGVDFGTTDAHKECPIKKFFK